MDKLISLAIVLLLYGICKILEHFHLFNFLQIILVFLMFFAFLYGISPNMGNRIGQYHKIHYFNYKLKS